MITIDKQVPMPTGGKGRAIYPWKQLNIGDSFLATNVRPGSMRTYASRMGRDLGWRFTLHKVDGGVRVWRIA